MPAGKCRIFAQASHSSSFCPTSIISTLFSVHVAVIYVMHACNGQIKLQKLNFMVEKELVDLTQKD